MNEVDFLTREALISEAQRLAQELGRVPSKASVVGHGQYELTDFLDEFGNWETVLEEAGFDPEELRQERYRVITDEDFLKEMAELRQGDREDQFRASLLLELKRLAEELGRTPTAEDMNSLGEYSRQAYRTRWGWSEAVEKAGLTPNHGGQGATISQEDLKEEIRRLKETLGRRPTLSDLRERGVYSHTPYYREFGSWTKACEAALDADD